ncbi:hypothetical protein B0J13DRAFT_453910 [Dactylonectria estremocensis]|uniref:Nucleotide-diphospho-sugar transferase domain-containing protein n=1 Tax=Dactylonectria estremocensis TaxID=1079267 RepID=A0A9P9IMD5_9HYPO|nr:hypothetical protein B0J13DRAFT_453910 [Dactylonectria estremocensis]
MSQALQSFSFTRIFILIASQALLLILFYGPESLNVRQYDPDNKAPVHQPPVEDVPDNASATPPKLSPEELIQQLFSSVTTSITAPSFTLDNGEVLHLPPGKLPYPNRLGKKICILDMDGRGFDGENQPWSAGRISWDAMSGSSPGVFNHYLYAMIHGYTYKYIRTAKPDWGMPVWSEIPAMKSILADYDVVVSLDTDAIFPNLLLPYEWMMNRWNITEDIAFAMSPDRKGPWNHDAKGRLRHNPGFITVRNIPIAHEMLDAWITCPARIPGCNKHANRFPAEMAAWGDFVRDEKPEYNRATKSLPCAEANGFAEQPSECDGKLLSHYTTGKKLVKPRTGDFAVQALFQVLQNDMQHRKDELRREDAEFAAGSGLKEMHVPPVSRKGKPGHS